MTAEIRNDVISRKKYWWRREMSRAVFSGWSAMCFKRYGSLSKRELMCHVRSHDV